MTDQDVLHAIKGEPGSFLFWCPGCRCGHAVDSRWTVTGPMTAPTIRASVLHLHSPPRCHLFVTDGKIRFLADCTHPLVGKTVAMETF